MSIAPSDIAKMLSTTSGSAGNTTAQANPNLALGKWLSTTAIVDNTNDNAYDDLSASDNVNLVVDYRGFFLLNNHATLTATGGKLWLPTPSNGAVLALSVDTTGAVAKGSGTAQMKQIANETTAPASQTFSTPTTQGAGITVPDLAPGQCVGVWLKRTGANGSPLAALAKVRYSFVSPP